MMRRALLAALCGAALVATATAANAQPPQPTAIAVANDCGKVTLTLTGPDDGISDTHGFRWNAVNGSVATDVGVRTGTVVVADSDAKTVDIVFSEDEFGGTAAVTVAVFFGPNSYIQKPLDIYPVDTDCKDPGEDPQVTPAPTVTELCAAADIDAAAELIAGAELNTDLDVLDGLLALDGELIGGFESGVELVAVRDALGCDDGSQGGTDAATGATGDEFDCADFPLADGRTSQDVLAADPSDPNGLDRDGDGTACDLGDLDPVDDGDFDQVGTPPVGGVATGG